MSPTWSFCSNIGTLQPPEKKRRKGFNHFKIHKIRKYNLTYDFNWLLGDVVEILSPLSKCHFSNL